MLTTTAIAAQASQYVSVDRPSQHARCYDKHNLPLLLLLLWLGCCCIDTSIRYSSRAGSFRQGVRFSRDSTSLRVRLWYWNRREFPSLPLDPPFLTACSLELAEFCGFPLFLRALG